AVMTSAKESAELVPGLKVAFHLLDDEGGIGRQLMGMAGRYGQVIKAPHFIVALSEKKPGYMENLGFRMETMILEATRHGLGTCWTGGMWKEANLKKIMNIGSDMRVIALTPLGFEDKSLTGSLLNKAISLSAPHRARRHPFEKIVYTEKWEMPAREVNIPAHLRDCLEAARLAPSWGNFQPSRFLVSRDYTIVTAMEQRAAFIKNLKEGKPYFRLDAGIAMQHFQVLWQEKNNNTYDWNISSFDSEELKARHAIPEKVVIIGVFPVGLFNPGAEGER
ncbi:MAG: hypothetical protein GY846_26375, partial [Deltaproteobacteria bacterium]|nr:hypothetical protein [Deltaproteobacteria bacterium]